LDTSDIEDMNTETFQIFHTTPIYCQEPYLILETFDS